MIFLPGTDKQLRYFLGIVNPERKNILLAGSGLHQAAVNLAEFNPSGIQLITDNESDILDMRMYLKSKNIPVKFMDYTRTDYKDQTFDLIYSQAAFSTSARRKIYREMRRILKDDGIMCTGEIITASAEYPDFMKNIWDSSGILPLTEEAVKEFLNLENFIVIDSADLSDTLKEFYSGSRSRLNSFLESGTDEEKRYYKKFLNKISHESNAYLKLGGDRYMKFFAFILEKMIEKR